MRTYLVAIMTMAAFVVAPTAYARVTEHCPAPTSITFADGSYRASGQTYGSRWTGTPSSNGSGDVRDFVDAEFHAVLATNPNVIFGFIEGCAYRLASGTVLMKYEGGGSPLMVLRPPHVWRAVSRGSWLYRCSRSREQCRFTTS